MINNKVITKRYKDEIFVWDPASFQGRGYWYVLGTKGGYGRAASKAEAKYLKRPPEADKEPEQTYKEEVEPVLEEQHPNDVEDVPQEKLDPKQQKFASKQAAKNAKRAGYAWGRRTRRRSMTDIFTEQVLGGKGVFSAAAGTVGAKFKAKKEGIKEFFDIKERFHPLNIAKKMTGGSALGPVLLGRMLGSSPEDIAHYSDTPYARKYDKRKTSMSLLKPTSTSAGKITPLPGNDVNDSAEKLYGLFNMYFEENKRIREEKRSLQEEEKNESDKRHQQLLDALGAKGSKPTAQKEKEKEEEKGIFDTVSDMFGLGKDALTIFKMLGTFAMGPVGLAILGVASLGALAYLIISNSSSKANEESAKGAAGSMDVSTEGAAIMEAASDVVATRRARILRQANVDGLFKTSMFNFPGRAKEEKDYLKSIGFDEKTGLTQAERDNGFNAVDDEGVPYVVPSAAPTAKAAPVPIPAEAERTGNGVGSILGEGTSAGRTGNGVGSILGDTSGRTGNGVGSILNAPSATKVQPPETPNITVPPIPPELTTMANRMGIDLEDAHSQMSEMARQVQESAINYVNNNNLSGGIPDQLPDIFGSGSVRNDDETLMKALKDSWRFI